jgi:hypothetical protein
VSTTGRAPTVRWVVSSLDDDGLDVDVLVEVPLLEVLLELLQAAARTAIARLAAAVVDARPARVDLMTLLTVR